MGKEATRCEKRHKLAVKIKVRRDRKSTNCLRLLNLLSDTIYIIINLMFFFFFGLYSLAPVFGRVSNKCMGKTRFTS